MADVNEVLKNLMRADGAVCAALADTLSGIMLAGVGTGLDQEQVAAGDSEILRCQLKLIKQQHMDDTLEDILITLGKQFHIIRPVRDDAGLFLCLVLDREHANLAMARRFCQAAAGSLTF